MPVEELLAEPVPEELAEPVMLGEEEPVPEMLIEPVCEALQELLGVGGGVLVKDSALPRTNTSKVPATVP